jgi:hypothetical protein
MRRRRKDHAEPAEVEEATGTQEGPATGPYDVEDHPLEEDDPSRIDLGALSIAGHPDLEVRLQVDEASGTVVAALLVAEDGALEVRPFAASRHHAMWDDVRAEILADLQRQGAGATEVDGPYGKALHILVQGQTPDGQTVTQPTLLVGIDGPRWLLRVSAYGRPASQWQPDGLLETALSQVVVVRGTSPMPPGDALPLQLPPEAQRPA